MNKTPKLPLYDQAIRYLSLKMHSKEDLAAKLANKGYERSQIDQILGQLEEEGLINDEKYAQIFLQNLIEYRSFGYYGIRNKLVLKRLNKELVDRLLESSLDEEAELAIGRKFLAKSINKKRSQSSLASALRQKGFRTSVIIKLLKS